MPGITMEPNNANGASKEPVSDVHHIPAANPPFLDRYSSNTISGNAPRPHDDAGIPGETYNQVRVRMPHDAQLGDGDTGSPLRQLAPEIVHISHGFVPFSMLVNRVSQQCWIDLTEIITELAGPQIRLEEAAVASTDAGKLKTGNNGGVQVDELIRKKIQLLEFAQAKRADFIKLLVLSNWSRQAAEVSRLIDLQAFIRMRYDSYNDALLHAASLKRDLIRAQTANPDLATSLESLMRGSVRGISMLGFTFPQALSPKGILDIFRRINRIIRMRLLLHDSIPPPFRNYVVCDGRVKFIVPSEFEVDLAIAEEPWHSQLFFVDIRFLFSPTLHSPRGALFDKVDQKVNAALRDTGLIGCYDLLQNLTLTYKILILFKQAVSLSNGQWLDTLRVDLLRRTLVVQYWSNRPGPKSWIEIGVSKTFSKNSKATGAVFGPSLCLRWFRENSETDPGEVRFDLRALCMETILCSITSLHISHLLVSTYSKLCECRLYAQHGLQAALSTSATEPGDCWLDIEITKTKQLKATMDPVTGLTLLRATPPPMNRLGIEAILDKTVAEDLFSRICRIRCSAVRDEVESHLTLSGWELMNPQNVKQADIRRLFPLGTSRYIVFAMRKQWHRDWLVAFTSSVDGDSWWIVQLHGEHSKAQSLGREVRPGTFSLKAIHQVKGETLRLSQSPVFSCFSRLTRALSTMVELHANLAFLKGSQNEQEGTLKDEIHSSFLLPSINFRFLDTNIPRVLQISPAVLQNKLCVDQGGVHLSFHGVDEQSSCAIVTAHGYLDEHVKALSVLQDGAFLEMAFRTEGRHFAVSWLAPIGQSIMIPLLTQLQQLQVVVASLGSLLKRRMVPRKVSLTKIDFAYAQGSEHRGSVRFNYRLTNGARSSSSIGIDEGNFTAFRLRMDLDFPPRSPYRRIKESLVNTLNDFRNGLDSTLGLLIAILPLLRALDRLYVWKDENASPAGLPQIWARSQNTFQIQYPSPGINFRVQLGRRHDHIVWALRKSSMCEGEPSTQLLFEKFLVNELYHSHGNGWRGLEGGAIAELGKVENLMADLHDIFQNTKLHDIISTEAERPNQHGGKGLAPNGVKLDNKLQHGGSIQNVITID